jgi:hypothetical protein
MVLGYRVNTTSWFLIIDISGSCFDLPLVHFGCWKCQFKKNGCSILRNLSVEEVDVKYVL